ncbi:hypothetical protein [uncultured Piscinibacter sp.]|uniref:hypothetical protein n=1 Tax=uncultured Piscinibacter sp. TaxID=1131835 RepID=UPI0026274B64|nr:hypothetical protein [uncultured Piscinibacter sp.]
MKNSLIRWSVQLTLGALAFLARWPMLEPLSNVVTRALARITVRAKRIGPARSTSELGPLWQRSFPSKKHVPIESTSEQTVIAQIHTHCPLRGSGNLNACYRMMEFDREVMRHAGGQFVVLQSQATPGVSHCRVAMRMRGESLAGLVPAHLASRTGNTP